MADAMTSTRLQPFAVAAALIVAMYLSWLVLRPLLSVLAWAVVLVVLFQPVHVRIERRVGAGAWAAALSTALVVVVVLVPTALVVTAVVDELSDMAVQMPTSLGALLEPSHPVTGPVVRVVERVVDLDRYRESGALRDSLEAWTGTLATQSLWVLGGAITGVVRMGLIVLTMFFLFKDSRQIARRLYEFLPIENRRLRALFRRTRDVVEASVYGTLLLAVVQGALGGLAFLVLGLPSPFLWGVVMIVASVVPLVGSSIVWGPAAVYLAVSGSWWQAIALVVWGAVLIGLADNVLRPILVGNRTRMSELVVLFGVLGGLQVFGVLGLVLGPVIFAVTLALARAMREVGPDASLRRRAFATAPLPAAVRRGRP
ncbi:MAG: AI-2E family transporter [Vicinamibacterales bacterium]